MNLTIGIHSHIAADVNGDCRKDIVAFGDYGVFVTLSPQCSRYAYRTANPEASDDQSVTDAIHQPGEVNIFPNPGSGQFKIGFAEEGTKTIVIMDVTGRIVLEEQTFDKTIDVDLSTEPKGVYIVKSVINGKILFGKYINQ